MKKKVITALLISITIASLTACGSEEYKQAYSEAQAEMDKQTAEMEKEMAEMEKQAEEIMNGKNEEPAANDAPDTNVGESDDKDEAAPAEEPKEEYPNEVDGINVTFYESVHNDKTGNWRLAVIYDGSDLNDYVGDFYKAYVKDDSEVFGIVNLGLKTSARISKMYDNWLDVTVTEYQDGEEHDAVKLYSGMELDHYWIDMETGEIDTLEE